MLDQKDRALRLAPRVTSLATERVPFPRGAAMPAIDLTDEIVEVLSEAAVEIANLSSPENVVCGRLRALQRKLAPRNVTVGEVAKRINVSPGEVLEGAISAGFGPFWHEGRQFRDMNYLRTYLRLQFHYDPVPEVEFNLTPYLADRLAAELGVTVPDLTSDAEPQNSRGPCDAVGKGPRKFVGSEAQLPAHANSQDAREQFG
jgi:hypothetical protein